MKFGTGACKDLDALPKMTTKYKNVCGESAAFTLFGYGHNSCRSNARFSSTTGLHRFCDIDADRRDNAMFKESFTSANSLHSKVANCLCGVFNQKVACVIVAVGSDVAVHIFVGSRECGPDVSINS